MNYRPQYQFPTPPGFRDLDFDHYYDLLMLPQLTRTTTDPNPTLNIPLRLDPDAPFLWRGVKFPGADSNLAPAYMNFGIRLRDPFGNPLCGQNSFVPVWLFGVVPEQYAAVSTSAPAYTGVGPCCLLPGGEEILCPANSVIYLDIFSYDTTPWTRGGPGSLWLCGVKRYPDGPGCGGGDVG